ncbi:DMT family transporter [Paraburkholderia sp. HD33-4]|uniref:DMT family transporter n=1 Tax=Paraburkholderia sp. HD33-4 TaxID=2883242 RepID=UPI001F26076A|nr:DMT family transporter [Paraburkholderia sp. HD33-4]
MNTYFTIALLVAAGIAVVVQNVLMVRITETVSTVLITLVINSSIGLALLLTTLLMRSGLNGILEAVSAVRPWAILPGLFGSFFVFAGIIGYQKVGAAATIAVIVASQLVAGLLFDTFKTATLEAPRISVPSVLGVGFLVLGAVLIAHRRM